MITMLVLWIVLSVGSIWAFDLLVIQEAQHPFEAIAAGSMIGFAASNLLFLLTGI